MKKKMLRVDNILNLMLVFVPAAIVLEMLHGDPVRVFAAASLAIVPLAGIMGKATEHLATRLGEGIGGLLNATFGNAAELIIALMALRAGLHEVVKASITGSIIGNVLLVFGLSALAGGLKHRKQTFNPTAAGVGSTLLALSVVGLVIPAVFDRVASGKLAAAGVAAAERELSLEIAVVLVVTYALSLVFTLKTHPHLYVGASHGAEAASDAIGTHGWSRAKSIGVLLGATALVALMSEILVGAVEETAAELGMTEVFVGVILVAIIGNAAEHSTAVLMAVKNKMNLAINIAVGSSIQVALFVAPVLVFVSFLVGPEPMDLLFTTFEVVAVALCAGVIALIAHDGESNWLEGVMLLAVYLMLGIVFYFIPA